MAKLADRRVGVTYHPSGIWHVLRLTGWSCQKPERRARKRDDDAIVQWRKKDCP